jgi:hypothetical protein
VKGVPQRETFLSTRPSTNEDAPPPGTVCGPVADCSPRGHPDTLLSAGGGSVPETDEPASSRGEVDQLEEIRAERDRLRVQLRDALGQVEYWRTLAEYRKAMFDEQREQSRQPRYFLDGSPS